MKEFNLNQIELITLDMLVNKDHKYRKMLNLLNFTSLCKPIMKLNRKENTGGKQGYGITKLFKCIFIITSFTKLSFMHLETFDL